MNLKMGKKSFRVLDEVWRVTCQRITQESIVLLSLQEGQAQLQPRHLRNLHARHSRKMLAPQLAYSRNAARDCDFLS